MERILNPSLGEKAAKPSNAVPVRSKSERVQEEYKLRRLQKVTPEYPTPPVTADPYLWNRKIQGDPYGDLGPKAEVAYSRMDVGRRMGPSKMIEIRPGVLHALEDERDRISHHPDHISHPPSQNPHPGRRLPHEDPPPRRSRPISAPARGRPKTGYGVFTFDDDPAVYDSDLVRGLRGGGGGGAGEGGLRERRESYAPPPPPPPTYRPRVSSATAAHRLLLPQLLQVEDKMRSEIQKREEMHVTDRTILLRAFGRVLNIHESAIGPKDKVTPAQFVAAWRRLGVSLTAAEAAAFFVKYGHDAKGMMPVTNFANALVMGGARQVMAGKEGKIQKGAYVAGKPGTHNGKIVYPQCKMGVWPPSDWDPSLALRSSKPPSDVALKLEFVHGYNGHQTTSQNVFYNDRGEIVYFAAAVGIVYDKASHTQRFFLGHDDDITCLALHSDRSTVATGQLGSKPCVLLWDSTGRGSRGGEGGEGAGGGECRLIGRLPFQLSDRGVQAVAFSPPRPGDEAGSLLACINLDTSHSLTILAAATAPDRAAKDVSRRAAAVYGIAWSSYEPDRLATYGLNHLKFWNLNIDSAAIRAAKGEGGVVDVKKKGGKPTPANAATAAAPPSPFTCSPTSDAGVFSLGKTHSIFSAIFLPSGLVLTGNAAGAIGTWRGNRLVRVTQAHGEGALHRRPDGKPER
eukprot:CAMPEP_0175056820 /NCGR_PEP_ID=MMETSP0052_2-20121109/10898_1 /TAXON_ID=51329 ORGANISM="Polytomella parva, Strain SAG 63-3" /NCGR_SAMPLE_ID=MMETSP0052_2 /ASSEMBLY_ACC=CAM_ASM_000194 /LENGTH=683 /DNA_ID=CAMNT_0016321919 /DNA_START=241 /DNA_END=2291 /DNA_ORIENTATION=+